MKNIFIGLLFLLGTFLIVFSLDNFPSQKNQSKSDSSPFSEGQILGQKIRSDLSQLIEQNQIPLEMNSLKSIQIEPHSERSATWIKDDDLKDLFPTKNETGTHHLEIDVVEWSDNSKYGAIIQFNLFDAKSQNKIWEMSRDYNLTPDQQNN